MQWPSGWFDSSAGFMISALEMREKKDDDNEVFSPHPTTNVFAFVSSQ
jgi:hypothetical protein